MVRGLGAGLGVLGVAILPALLRRSLDPRSFDFDKASNSSAAERSSLKFGRLGGFVRSLVSLFARLLWL